MIRISFCFYLFFIASLYSYGQEGSSDSQITLTEEIRLEVIRAEKACFNAYHKNDEETFKICSDALAKSKNAGLDSFSIQNLSALIFTKYFNEGPKASHPYSLEAKKIAEKPGNHRLKPRAYYDYSLTWESLMDIESAVEYLNQAIEIANDNNDNELQAKLISGMGFLFTSAELFEDSKKYFSKGLKVAQKQKDDYTIALIHTYLAVAHRELGEYEESNKYYNEAAKFLIDNKNPRLAKMVIFGQAQVEHKKGNYKLSNDILMSNSPLYKGEKVELKKVGKCLVARNYLSLKYYDRALEYFKEVESSILEIGDDDIKKDLYKNIGDCYKNTGKLEKAIEYYTVQAEQSKLYVDTKIEQSITTAELKYQLRNEESENKYLSSEKEKLEIENKSRFLILILSLFSLLVLSLFSFLVYKKLNRRNIFLKDITVEKEKINKNLLKQSLEKESINENLVYQNKELTFFAGIVAHDIKAPIRTTSAFIQLIKKRLHGAGNIDSRVDEYIKLIEQSNANLHVLIDDLLEYTKSGQTKNKFETIDLNEILATVKNNLSSQTRIIYKYNCVSTTAY